MGLISELRRRNVFRVAIAYMIIAWIILQVGDVLAPALLLDDWVNRVLAFFLILGFPAALVFAWAFELTPEGLKLEKHVDRDRSITHLTGRKLDYFIIIVLVVALSFFAVDKWVPGPARDGQTMQVTADAASDEATESADEEMSRVSIAVLPFADLSPEGNQEYFSDGISEEILNLLAKVPKLRVTSRSSAFSFKGQNVDIPTIAEKLSVAHILEGSVRKAGSQVRITAQLIEAGTDTHLWSETYDRTLDDIFATQDEIAANVVDELKITLLGDAPTVQTTDPDAYALALRARYLARRLTPDAFEKSISLLEQALKIDANYAPAWAGLAEAYERQAGKGLRPFDEGYTLAREAANRALALDPLNVSAYCSLARIARIYDQDFEAAAKHYEQALAMEPTDTVSISRAARMATSLGRLDQAIALAEYTAVRDPVDPGVIGNVALLYLYAGRLDDAVVYWRTTLILSPDYIGAQYWTGIALLLNGDPQAGLAEIQKEAFDVFRLIGLAMAHHALGETDASDEALATLIENHEEEWAYNIAYVLAFRGEADQAFEWLDKAVDYNDPGLAEIAIDPLFANIRDDARWLPFLESIGKSPEQLASIEFEVTLPK